MKFIVIGLGNFGSSLALTLTAAGHEVIGIDNNELYINMYKDKLTHIIKMDSTSEMAVKQLPLNDTDAVIIGIGEDTGSAITAAALFKKNLPSCRIVARYTSEIQKTIFEAMGIEEMVNPEAEFAESFAQRLTNASNINTYILDENYEIAEVKIPESFIGKKQADIDLLKTWNVSLITIIRHNLKKNLLGIEIPISRVEGVISVDTSFEENDTLVIFGKIKDLNKVQKSLS